VKKRTPWQILGLSEEADKKEIRKAHRRLAKKYHPDRNPGNPEAGDQFKEVQMADETLISRTAMSGRPKAPDFPKEGSSPSAENQPERSKT
jgi:DnaJ-class molecular chaperone